MFLPRTRIETDRFGAAGELAIILERDLKMSNPRYYSDFFHCVHDEPSDYGSLGRGTHYSILRAIEWLDVIGKPVSNGLVHDFAVIWDEDHDTRVIEAIERMYMEGLLFAVQFVGERKGTITVIVDPKFYRQLGNSGLDTYKRKIEEITSSLSSGDDWPCDVGTFSKPIFKSSSPQPEYGWLINDSFERVDTYLRNIDNLWSLGSRKYVAPKYVEPVMIGQPLSF